MQGNYHFLQSKSKPEAIGTQSSNCTVGNDGVQHKIIEYFRRKRPIALLENEESTGPGSESTELSTHHIDHTDEEYVGSFIGLGFVQLKISLAQSDYSGLNDNWIRKVTTISFVTSVSYHRAEASPSPKNSSQKGRLWTPRRFEYYASSW